MRFQTRGGGNGPARLWRDSERITGARALSTCRTAIANSCRRRAARSFSDRCGDDSCEASENFESAFVRNCFDQSFASGHNMFVRLRRGGNRRVARAFAFPENAGKSLLAARFLPGSASPRARRADDEMRRTSSACSRQCSGQGVIVRPGAFRLVRSRPGFLPRPARRNDSNSAAARKSASATGSRAGSLPHGSGGIVSYGSAASITAAISSKGTAPWIVSSPMMKVGVDWISFASMCTFAWSTR